jgi:ATP-dependent RNA helicase SUPV3L1/SUV3
MPHNPERQSNEAGPKTINSTDKLPRALARISVNQQARAAGYRSILNHNTTVSNLHLTKYGVFEKLLIEQHGKMMNRLAGGDPDAVAIRNAWGIKSIKHLRAKATEFKEMISKCLKVAEKDAITDKVGNYLFYRLRHAFIHEDTIGLAAELKYAFMNLVLEKQYPAQEGANQKLLTDLRYPIEWFPATRMMQRKIHLHVGPTNSGKTYHALQRLEAAKTGIYAGPLRLLAHEVYTRLNAKGIPCALITGEERRIPDGLNVMMSSCTVEMVPLNTKVDVAVIDEIQMLGDIDRGWAWTQAFLGVMAKEVHLCGELRTVPLIRDLCAAMGDELEIHEYKRLNPLQVSKKSLGGDLTKLEKGDAIILFSRVQIHAMKKDIEVATGRRCAVVYGSLPPETRAQQANLFNDPDNDYDFLVASDAVGMGLNLSIKRIIFETTWKYDGAAYQPMDVPDLKQIAGRAGRYRTARDDIQKEPVDLTDGEPADIQPPLQLSDPGISEPAESVGYVTTLEHLDLPVVRFALGSEPEPLKTAGVLPPSSVLTRFASYFPPRTPFSYILLRLHDISTLDSCFKLCRLKEQVQIADLIHPYQLSVKDMITFTAAPVSLRDPGFTPVLVELAKCVAEKSSGHILDIKSMNFGLLDARPEEWKDSESAYLREIETLHKAITLYLWLSYRLAGVFQSQALAFHVKDLAEKKINECLANIAWDSALREKSRLRRLKFLAKKGVATGTDQDMVRERLELADEEDIEIVDGRRATLVDTGHTAAILPDVDFFQNSHKLHELPASSGKVPKTAN